MFLLIGAHRPQKHNGVVLITLHFVEVFPEDRFVPAVIVEEQIVLKVLALLLVIGGDDTRGASLGGEGRNSQQRTIAAIRFPADRRCGIFSTLDRM